MENVMGRILWAFNNARSVSVPVEVDGRIFHVIGRRTQMTSDHPMMVLLEEGGTLKRPKLVGGVEKSFEEAARGLVEGNRFYTVLRPELVFPAFLWELESAPN